MTHKQPIHPNRYPILLKSSRQRAAAAIAVDRRFHDQQNEIEFAAFADDPLGFAGRMEYAQTVTHIWEKFALSKRAVLRMSTYIECNGDETEVIRPLPLKTPDVVYAHFPPELQVHLRHSDTTIEGMYLWRTAEFGEEICVYMVTCSGSGLNSMSMTLGEIAIEKTRVAIGTVDMGASLGDTVEDTIGDPVVREAIRNPLIQEIMEHTVALFQGPGAFPNRRPEPIASQHPAPKV